MTERLEFLLYYIKKRISVGLGFHRTKNPLTLRWRWEYWIHNRDEIKKNKRREKLLLAKRKTNQSN